jgi:hypothetical protein
LAVLEFVAICTLCVAAWIWIGTRPSDPDGASLWSKVDAHTRRRILQFAIIVIGFMLPELILLPRRTRRG